MMNERDDMQTPQAGVPQKPPIAPATGPAVGDERDVLVSRVVDGEADPSDWTKLRAIAERDPSVWSDITETQADHESLRDAVMGAIDIADDIDLPTFVPDHHETGFNHRLGAVRSWGGWAAAAAIMLVWATGIPAPSHSDQGGPVEASLLPTQGLIPQSISPEELREQYITRGQKNGLVVGEVADPVVLEVRPMADGKNVEVLLVRQIIERQIVNQVYRTTFDESGQVAPVTVPVKEPFVQRMH